VLGVFLILAALSAIAGVAYLRLFVLDPVEIDAESLCPKSGPVGDLIVLLDVTDPLAPSQYEQILARISREIEEAPVFTRVTFGLVSPDLHSRGGESLNLCKPPSGEDANQLYENPKLLEQRFRERFVRPLEAALKRLLLSEPANSSPIMESLQLLVARATLSSRDERPLRLVVISDLLQHSETFSFYRGDRWKTFKGSREVERVGTTLSGADVLLLQIPRPSVGAVSIEEIDEFWAEYFNLQGARRVKKEVIGDL